MEPTTQQLDSFLTTIESKLRNPFTSLEISKFASSSSSDGNEARMLPLVFPRMQKSLKCKVLVGILAAFGAVESLNYSQQQQQQQQQNHLDVIEKSFLDVLDLAVLEDEDEWVRVLGQIVKYKIEDDHNNYCEETKDKADSSVISVVQSSAQQILSDVMKEHSAMDNSKIVDPLPLVGPFYYSLVADSEILNTDDRVKSDDDNRHFKTDWDASILQIDRNLETKRSVDDVDQFNSNNVISSLVAKRSNNDTRNDERINLSCKSPTQLSKQSLAPSLQRSFGITKSSISSALSSDQPVKRYGAAASVGMKKKSNIKAILERKKQQQAQQQSQATRSNQSSLAVPGGVMKARARAEAHRTSAHTAAGKFSSRYQGAGSSKMKMIDITTVKDVNNKDKMLEEARSGSLKRRILKAGEEVKNTVQSIEKDEANEPKNKKPRASLIDNETKLKQVPASDNVNKEGAIDKPSSIESAPHLEPSKKHDPNANQSQVIPSSNEHAKAQNISIQNKSQTSTWQQLLDKSNKLSLEDRNRVEQFFTTQFNPTPDHTIYKMKLNEEKATQPDGSTVKETLYLELDYSTYGFKKLRKIKKK